MYTSIVVPLDGSEYGKRALPVALALARRSDAAVHLVHVHELHVNAGTAPASDTRLSDDLRQELRSELIGLAAQLSRDTALHVNAEFLDGPVVPTLERYLASRNHDLVVMMTHGHGGLTHAWLGSVTDGLVRHAPVPLLLLRTGSEWPSDVLEPIFCRVLVPLDGSASSDEVLDQAVALNTPDATVYTLLTVVVPLPMLGQANLPFDARENSSGLDGQEEAAQAHLNAMAEELRESGALVETRLVTNQRPAQGILDAADEQHVDSIALATHGRGALSRLVLGSVADEVVRGATVPVLIYRPATIAASVQGNETAAWTGRSAGAPNAR